ncbi:MAG: tetratricopeptide repeat protein [Terriglobia bacterium]|jgi:predicted Zn-dependent protease
MRVKVLPRLLLPIVTLVAVLTIAAADSDQAESALRAGNRFFDKGRFADAVDMYTRALEQDPQDVKVYYNRALANEMVDRKAAMRDWRRFVELAGTNPAWKAAASQAQERLRTLEVMPALPDSLQPSRYLPRAGDYYQDVAQGSRGLQFSKFPVKVFVGSVPEDWQRATREALDGWIQVFPLEEVASREGADIVLSWTRSAKESLRPGWEEDWVQVQKKDDGTIVKRTRVAFVTLDCSHHWPEDQKRATVSHEIGHALGIQGHSDSPKDIMFPLIQETLTKPTDQGLGPAPPYFEPSPVNPSPSMPKKPSQRDVNTLIRLYNSPGPLMRPTWRSQSVEFARSNARQNRA